MSQRRNVPLLTTFDLHRQVSMLAPAMACCPALLTAAPPRLPHCRRSWFASRCRAAAPPFPQPLAQFLQFRTRMESILPAQHEITVPMRGSRSPVSALYRLGRPS